MSDKILEDMSDEMLGVMIARHLSVAQILTEYLDESEQKKDITKNLNSAIIKCRRLSYGWKKFKLDEKVKE